MIAACLDLLTGTRGRQIMSVMSYWGLLRETEELWAVYAFLSQKIRITGFITLLLMSLNQLESEPASTAAPEAPQRSLCWMEEEHLAESPPSLNHHQSLWLQETQKASQLLIPMCKQPWERADAELDLTGLLIS